MVTLTNQIFVDEFMPALRDLGQANLDISLSFEVAKIIKILQDAEDLFMAERLKIFKKYGKENLETGMIEIDPKDIKKNKSKDADMAVLKSISTDYNFNKLTLRGTFAIRPVVLANLLPIIEKVD